MGISRLLLALLFLGTLNTSFASDSKYWIIEFLDTKGAPVSARVEVADSDEKKRTGLMFREYMPENEGMIFPYDEEIVLNFWMKNTRLSLSIVFIDKHYRIIKIAEMVPFDLRITSSGKKAMYAIEMNRDWFKKNKIKSGSIVKIQEE